MITLLIGTLLGIALAVCARFIRLYGPVWWSLVFAKKPVIANYRIDMTLNGQRHSFTTFGKEGRFAMEIRQRDGRRYAEPPWEVSGFASAKGELTFSVGRGRMEGADPMYFKRKTQR